MILSKLYLIEQHIKERRLKVYTPQLHSIIFCDVLGYNKIRNLHISDVFGNPALVSESSSDLARRTSTSAAPQEGPTPPSPPLRKVNQLAEVAHHPYGLCVLKKCISQARVLRPQLSPGTLAAPEPGSPNRFALQPG